MKTLRFGRIKIDTLDDGEVMLRASSPGQGSVELMLTADELMIFLTEVGNQLTVSRDIELKNRIAKDLEYEERKSKKTNQDSTTTKEDE